MNYLIKHHRIHNTNFYNIYQSLKHCKDVHTDLIIVVFKSITSDHIYISSIHTGY
jgi:hypothetical protein